MARSGDVYSEEDDLLIGDLPLGSAYPPSKFLAAASDEIDSYLGRMYDVPITLADVDPVVQLTLKRINNWLASGRLVMAVATAGQDTELHAYGWSLVSQAMGDIQKILEGDLTLPGLDVVSYNTVEEGTGPMVSNVDDESRIEAFYDDFIIDPYTLPLSGVRYIP